LAPQPRNTEARQLRRAGPGGSARGLPPAAVAIHGRKAVHRHDHVITKNGRISTTVCRWVKPVLCDDEIMTENGPFRPKTGNNPTRGGSSIAHRSVWIVAAGDDIYSGGGATNSDSKLRE